MPANKLLKSFGIARAHVSYGVPDSHHEGSYIHPELFLRNADDQTVVRIKFQANCLTGFDAFGESMERYGTGLPCSSVFDFGPRPYGGCYAPKFLDAGSYSFGSLSASPARSEGRELRKLARLSDKIAATVNEYNLFRVEPGCELSLWILALEKLNVPVEIRRWVGNTELSVYAYKQDLPEEQRDPARKLIRARTEQATSKSQAT